MKKRLWRLLSGVAVVGGFGYGIGLVVAVAASYGVKSGALSMQSGINLVWGCGYWLGACTLGGWFWVVSRFVVDSDA